MRTPTARVVGLVLVDQRTFLGVTLAAPLAWVGAEVSELVPVTR